MNGREWARAKELEVASLEHEIEKSTDPIFALWLVGLLDRWKNFSGVA